MKASSGRCDTGLGQTVIRRALHHTLVEADRRCFCTEDNFRINAARCEIAFEHVFAKACTNLPTYCQGVGSIPDGDPCKP